MKDDIIFSDCIFKRVKDSSGIIEQKLPATFRYYKAQANITIVELVNLDKKNVI